jgi:hypothetical protein
MRKLKKKIDPEIERLMDHDLIKALLDSTNNFYDVLSTYNIRVSFTAIHDGIHALVYYSKKGFYNILINNALPFPIQQKAFLHEVKHIAGDMPKYTYIVGFDDCAEDIYRIEIEADQFMEAAAAAAYEAFPKK